MSVLSALEALARATAPTSGELNSTRALIGPLAASGWRDLGGADDAMAMADRLEAGGATRYDIFRDPRTQRMLRDIDNQWMRETPEDRLAWRPEFDPALNGPDGTAQRITHAVKDYPPRGAYREVPFNRIFEAPDLTEPYPYLGYAPVKLDWGGDGAAFRGNRQGMPDDIEFRIGTEALRAKDQRDPATGALAYMAHEGTHGGAQFGDGVAGGFAPVGWTENLRHPWVLGRFAREIEKRGNDLEILRAIGSNAEINDAELTLRMMQQNGPRPEVEGRAAYLNSRGEKPAWAVQSRINMTPDQRLEMPFWESEGDYRWLARNPLDLRREPTIGDRRGFGRAMAMWRARPDFEEQMRLLTRLGAGGGAMAALASIADNAQEEMTRGAY